MTDQMTDARALADSLDQIRDASYGVDEQRKLPFDVRDCLTAAAARLRTLSEPYSIDSDPLGIRERAAAAITGALACGAQNANPPPAGHWLQQFWDMGRAESELLRETASALSEQQEEAVVTYFGRWISPEGTRHFWGALSDSIDDLPRGTKLYTRPQPAAGDAVRAYSVLQIGNRGAAYDPPNTRRAFTYEDQPGNISASRLGAAAHATASATAGDSIDRGLALLKALQEAGFGVFEIGEAALSAALSPRADSAGGA